jgi:hypothetical protein
MDSNPREQMKIELTPDNAAALSKYAALAGHTPDELLNQYLADNMVAMFRNQKAVNLKAPMSDITPRLTLNELFA